MRIAISTVLLTFFCLAFISCGNFNKQNLNEHIDSLNTENQHLNKSNIVKDSTIGSFIHSFNTIQDNLDEIKSKEKIINSLSKDGDVKNKEDQIISDIQSIYELIERNKRQIAGMSSKLKHANVKVEELQKIIDRLNTQITEKDGEIANLKANLEQMNIELSSVKETLTETQQESNLKTSQLNTAFYAFGTSKELIKANVLTKDGGFIGIGKEIHMKDDFNRNYFTKIDISVTKEITLACKRAKLITTHPAGSYKFEGEQGYKISKLTITNAQDFWSISKYLVISIEQ